MCPMTMQMPDTLDDEQGDFNSIDDGGVDRLESTEVIEVPIRASAKVDVQIELSMLAVDDWRTCYTVRSLKTKDAGRIIAQNQLSTDRPPEKSRIFAICSVLDEVAKVMGGHDNRVKDDILKFKDTDWYITRETADHDPPADDDELAREIAEEHAEPKRHPDEPRANEFGVLTEDVEEFVAPMPKSWKSDASVRVAQDSKGRWYAGYEYGIKNNRSSAAPSINHVPYRSKKAAVVRMFIWMDVKEDCVRKAIDKYLVSVEAWEEVITATDLPAPPHDPDTQADIEDLKEVGISVGEAVASQNAAAPADQAMADFEVRLRSASDELVRCIMQRTKLEAELKHAKAEEKLAIEDVQTLQERGPERMPLFDQPKATASDASLVKAKPESAKPAADPDAWKLAPLSVLGLASGLHDRLVSDGLDTVGRLEQRRADVAQGREKWPKGVGKAAITKIEDAQIAWLTANQGKWQPEVAAAMDDDSVVEISGAITEEEIGDVASRAGILISQGFEPTESEMDTYESGKSAWASNWSLTDCPYVPGHEQDLWLIGFKDAEKDAEE